MFLKLIGEKSRCSPSSLGGEDLCGNAGLPVGKEKVTSRWKKNEDTIM